MGEVVAGIALGPTVLGALAPEVSGRALPDGHHPVHRGGRQPRADLLHVPGRARARPEPAQGAHRPGGGDLERERRAADDARARRRAADLRAGRARTRSSSPSRCSWASSMSITAFPVLARILVERRMLKRPVGALALACAAIDDVTAWFLIALATAVAVAGSGSEVARDDRAGDRLLPRDGLRRPAAARRACRPPTTRRAGCPAAGSRRSSPASCCPPTRPRRSASR